MAEQDNNELSGMPIHVREKARKAAEQDAAITAIAEERQRQIDAANQSSNQPAPQPQDGTQPPSQTPPAAEAQPVEPVAPTANGGNDMAALKGRIGELEAQLTEAENRLKTHYGRQRKLAEDRAAEVATLKEQIAALQAQSTAGTPEANSDEAVLRADGWTENEIDDATGSEKARAARMVRKAQADRKALEDRIASIDKRVAGATGNERLNAMDTAINAVYPGFLAAIKRDGKADVEWSIFASEPNSDSSEGLTFGDTFEQARKLGNREAALRVIALFAKANPRLSFQAAPGTDAGRVDIPPLRLMPGSGPAPQTPAPSPADTAPQKVRYPEAYSTAFHRLAAKRQGNNFQPFTVEGGGRTKTFNTLQEMMREKDALMEAADEGRLIKR